MMHKEQNSVWYKVIVARYVMDGWRVREGGRLGTTWWNHLFTVRLGVGGLTIIWCGWWVMRPKCVLARMFDWR
ncbi:transmembrane protein, putative [Medicago truncatula]|uniref:Transmembrane protein, putative n=1 Tax=Medicago truncatula TaxID=3880 RepID=G7JV90_MEDTR|nr:transmembrane protein, putative [Medicago truncatula]